MGKALFLISVAYALSPLSASAATYNFYFNNTEQGANSISTPTVIVGQPAAAVPSVGAGMGSEAAEKPADPAPAKASKGRWKLSLSAVRTTYFNRHQRFVLHGSDPRHIMGGVMFYPNPSVGLGFQVGRFIGPEVFFHPWGFKPGWGRFQFALTHAFLKDTEGFLATDSTGFWGFKYLFRKPPVVRHKPISMFWGAEAGVNVMKNLSMNFAYRWTPLSKANHRTNFLQASAAYSF
jgi:hypothetical protein